MAAGAIGDFPGGPFVRLDDCFAYGEQQVCGVSTTDLTFGLRDGGPGINRIGGDAGHTHTVTSDTEQVCLRVQYLDD